jgi:putative photosynthetic complex assembly protein
MSDHHHNQQFPRAVLLGAAALIGVSLLMVMTSRVNGIGTTRMPEARAVTVLDIRVEDRSDGAVAVYAADDDHLIMAFAPGTSGFVRGVMRGMARERRRDGIGHQPPFRLTRWSDGRLSLRDPSTGVVVNLEVFGPTNSAAFAQLIDPALRATPTATVGSAIAASSVTGS